MKNFQNKQTQAIGNFILCCWEWKIGKWNDTATLEDNLEICN